MGELTEEEKKYFTLVAVGMLRLQTAVFLSGCTGRNLDILAREPLWKQGMDYKCGTGHGVGYFLNVHEGPNGLRWKCSDDKVNSAVFEEGMITSNEPGFYLEGKYGIRTENMIVCVKDEKTEYGQFMRFENLTMVPYDIEAMDMSMLTEVDKVRINDYHKEVYEKISPYLDDEEKAWLKEVTKEV